MIKFLKFMAESNTHLKIGRFINSDGQEDWLIKASCNFGFTFVVIIYLLVDGLWKLFN